MAGVAVSLFAADVLPLPFLWLFWGWFAYFLHTSIRTNNTAIRITSINFATLLFIFGVAEIIYIIDARPPDESNAKPTANVVRVDYETSRETYIHDKDFLGFAPLPDNNVIGRRYEGDKLVYEVAYTIDSNGLRSTPTYRGVENGECILFFGGSFTLGEGVHEDETMPYNVGVETRDRYRIYNFGFHGYGPHQMLSALEHGLVDEILECQPKFIFYQVIRAHIKRSAGVRLTILDKHTPRYRLRQNGTLFFDGHYDEDSNAPEDTIIRRSAAYDLLSKSYFFKEMHRITVIFAEHLDLLIAIVDTSRRLVESRWPGSEFHVILWNERIQTKAKRLEWALEKGNFRVHRVGDILPGYLNDKDNYRITELDHHPNADAHARIADYLVSEILDEKLTSLK